MATEPTTTNHQFLTVIVAAISTLIVNALIKLGEWFFKKRSLKKAIQTGLYLEIKNHIFTELPDDSDGSPNIICASFHDDFYSKNLDKITTLLDNNFSQMLFFYYSKLRFSLNIQSTIEQLNNKLAELTGIRLPIPPKIRLKNDKYNKDRNTYRDILRRAMIPLHHLRNNLLEKLKMSFEEDPEKFAFIDVEPKYKNWFERIKKENVTIQKNVFNEEKKKT